MLYLFFLFVLDFFKLGFYMIEIKVELTYYQTPFSSGRFLFGRKYELHMCSVLHLLFLISLICYVCLDLLPAERWARRHPHWTQQGAECQGKNQLRKAWHIEDNPSITDCSLPFPTQYIVTRHLYIGAQTDLCLWCHFSRGIHFPSYSGSYYVEGLYV